MNARTESPAAEHMARSAGAEILVPGGYLTKFYTGRLRPRVQPLTYFLKYQFWPKRYPFHTLWRWAGKVRRELATTSLEFEFHFQFPCGSPSTGLSDFRQSARRGNERKGKQTLKKHVPRVMTSLLMSTSQVKSSQVTLFKHGKNIRHITVITF